MGADPEPGVAVEMKSAQYMLEAGNQGEKSLEEQAEDLYYLLLSKQDIGMGLVAGGLVAVLIAVTFPILDPTHLGWMGIVMGPAVGAVVRLQGRGFSPIFGGIAAGLTLMGCILGNIATIFFQHYFPGEDMEPIEFAELGVLQYVAYDPWMFLFYIAAMIGSFFLAFTQLSKLQILNQVRLAQGRIPK